jgi:hypothetical protein
MALNVGSPLNWVVADMVAGCIRPPLVEDRDGISTTDDASPELPPDGVATRRTFDADSDPIPF